MADVLSDVDPRDADQVLVLLARRGIVWTTTYRGEVTVYGEKPAEKGKRALVGKRPIDDLFADLGPLLLDAAKSVERHKPFGSSPEVREAVRVSIERIVAVCKRHAAKGLALGEMRSAMWSVLSSRLMTAIAFREPSLQERSEAEAFPVEKPRIKRLPKGLTDKGKVLAMIERAGPSGVTKTTIIRALNPKPSTDALHAIIGELDAEGAIVWADGMRTTTIGRAGLRLFAASVGLPKVGTDGTMLRREM